LVDYAFQIPQKLHGKKVKIQDVIVYHSALGVTKYLDIEILTEYNPIDGTNTPIVAGAVVIAAGTSYTFSFTDFELGTAETGSVLHVRMRYTLGGGGAVVLDIHGAQVVYNTDTL
jgi:hypothetical protein